MATLVITLAIGSTNSAKVQALEEVTNEYAPLKEAKVQSFSVPSQVSDQPLTLEETILGAKNRATAAFQACDGCSFGFGVESGLLAAPGTGTGFLHVSVCCIFDGSRCYTGMSTGFEVPPAILSHVVDKKMDLSQACLTTGITTNANIGSTEGLIGILTNGRVDRKEYSKQAIRSAVVQLEFAKWYR